jgi:hypothetical protein
MLSQMRRLEAPGPAFLVQFQLAAAEMDDLG